MTDGTGKVERGRGGARWRLAAWGGAGLLLVAPAVAMRFTDEVNWNGLDFAVFGAMLLAALGAFELGVRKARDTTARAAVAIAVGAAFVLVWAQLAVGVVGREKGPAGLAFVGLVALVVATALAVRFRRRT